MKRGCGYCGVKNADRAVEKEKPKGKGVLSGLLNLIKRNYPP